MPNKRYRVSIFIFFFFLLICTAAAGLFWYFSTHQTFLNPLSFSKTYPKVKHLLEVKKNDPTEKLIFGGKSETLFPDKDLKYLVYNSDTNKVYLYKDYEEKISPASFTKLLTAITALDLATSSATIDVDEVAITKEPTILGVRLGEQFYLDELLRAAISTSANDAAYLLAKGVSVRYGQDVDFFIDAMNQKAEIIGMAKSSFKNPEGYDEQNQYSTLLDISRLVSLVQKKYPEVVKAGSEDRIDITKTNSHGFYYLPNWNGLLGVYPGVDGLKIAYTEDSGYSTIVTAKRKSTSVTVILSGAVSIKQRDLYASRLLDYAFAKEGLEKINLTEEKLDIKYKVWSDLARKIRKELDELKSQQ